MAPTVTADWKYKHSGVCPVCGKTGTLRRSAWVDERGKQVRSRKGVSAVEMRKRGYRRQRVDGRCPECKADWDRSQVKERTRKGVRQLWCPTCKQWKPEKAFAACPKREYRGRRHQCRACDTRSKRDYRRRKREAA